MSMAQMVYDLGAKSAPTHVAHDAALPRLHVAHGGQWQGSERRDERGAYCRLRMRRPCDLLCYVACAGDERDGVPQCPDLVRCSANQATDDADRYARDQLNGARRGSGYQGWKTAPGLDLVERHAGARR